MSLSDPESVIPLRTSNGRGESVGQFRMAVAVVLPHLSSRSLGSALGERMSVGADPLPVPLVDVDLSTGRSRCKISRLEWAAKKTEADSRL